MLEPLFFNFYLHFTVGFTSDPEPVNTPPSYGNLFNQDTTRALQEAYSSPTQDVDPTAVICELSSVPKAYPSAARLFRWTCRSLSEALLYYRLDERCTEAIKLIRAHASAYNFLATFEADLARKVHDYFHPCCAVAWALKISSSNERWGWYWSSLLPTFHLISPLLQMQISVIRWTSRHIPSTI